MRIWTVLLRCTIGCVLGSSFGVAMFLAGWLDQGIGLAIIGGVLGIVLAISNSLYKTSAAETFSRGLLLFLKLTAAKNIHAAESLVHIEDRDIEGRLGQCADPKLLGDRMWVGMMVGVALAVVPAILILVYIQDANRQPDLLILDVMKRLIIGFVFVAMVGGVGGAALGSLTIPGVHRRNIVAGAMTGAIVGAGIATAAGPGAQIQLSHLYIGTCGGFGWFGMVCGLLSGDNFQSPV